MKFEELKRGDIFYMAGFYDIFIYEFIQKENDGYLCKNLEQKIYQILTNVFLPNTFLNKNEAIDKVILNMLSDIKKLENQKENE
jgi:hypothetical protein